MKRKTHVKNSTMVKHKNVLLYISIFCSTSPRGVFLDGSWNLTALSQNFWRSLPLLFYNFVYRANRGNVVKNKMTNLKKSWEVGDHRGDVINDNIKNRKWSLDKFRKKIWPKRKRKSIGVLLGKNRAIYEREPPEDEK